VVEPETMQVLEASDEAILTLVTCYPFSFYWLVPQKDLSSVRTKLPSNFYDQFLIGPGTHAAERIRR
jgi:hypothetical protein